MNNRRKCIVWAWIAVVAGMGMFPPWGHHEEATYWSHGYHVVFENQIGSIDAPRLILQWFIVTLVAAGLYFAWPGIPVRRWLANWRAFSEAHRIGVATATAAVIAALIIGAWFALSSLQPGPPITTGQPPTITGQPVRQPDIFDKVAGQEGKPQRKTYSVDDIAPETKPAQTQ